MTEQIKAWAVVNKDGVFNGTLYNSEYAANTRLTELQLIGKVAPYKLVELTSTPKIKMTPFAYNILVQHRNNSIRREDNIGFLEFMSTYSETGGTILHTDLMKAWLHPETIINIETGKPFVE